MLLKGFSYAMIAVFVCGVVSTLAASASILMN